MHEIPRLHTALIECLSDEIRRYQRAMSRLLGTRSAEEALAAFLLYIWEGALDAGLATDHCDLPMTYGEIASFLGLTRETITRLIARMKQAEILSYRGRSVYVTDEQALRAAASLHDAHALRARAR